MFTKKFLGLVFLIFVLAAGLAFSQTTMSVGVYTNGSISGGELGVDFGKFNLALRGGGSGFIVDTPTIDVSGSIVDSTGYTDSFEDTLFPSDGQSLSGNLSMFNLELRGSFDIVTTQYMSVFLGAGVSWTHAAITGEYVMNTDGDSLSLEGSVNVIGIPVFAGVEAELFERAPGLVFGISAGYLPQIPLDASGSVTMYNDDGAGNWTEVTYAIDIKPNMFAHGFFGDVYVKFSW